MLSLSLSCIIYYHFLHYFYISPSLALLLFTRQTAGSAGSAVVLGLAEAGARGKKAKDGEPSIEDQVCFACFLLFSFFSYKAERPLPWMTFICYS